MKIKKRVYSVRGKYGGGLSVYLLPKNKAVKGAYGGIDDIELVWSSSKEVKDMEVPHTIYINEFEALALIQGLTYALIEKEGTLLTKRKKQRRTKNKS